MVQAKHTYIIGKKCLCTYGTGKTCLYNYIISKKFLCTYVTGKTCLYTYIIGRKCFCTYGTSEKCLVSNLFLKGDRHCQFGNLLGQSQS